MGSWALRMILPCPTRRILFESALRENPPSHVLACLYQDRTALRRISVSCAPCIVSQTALSMSSFLPCQARRFPLERILKENTQRQGTLGTVSHRYHCRLLISKAAPYTPPGSPDLPASLQVLTLEGSTGNEEEFKMVNEMYVCFPDLGEYVLILSFSSWDQSANKYKIVESPGSPYPFVVSRRFGMQSILCLVYRQ